VPFTEQKVAQQRAAVQSIAGFAADELERIAAMSQTLLELMKQPRFYRSPTLAAAQLSAISDLAETAMASIDQMAEAAGVVRDRSSAQAIVAAEQAAHGASH